LIGTTLGVELTPGSIFDGDGYVDEVGGNWIVGCVLEMTAAKSSCWQ